MAKKLHTILVMVMLAVVSGLAITSCSNNDDGLDSDSDMYNLIGSHWIGNTRINTGDGLLLDNYASQYSITFNADGTCLMKGSDNSSKTYRWNYPQTNDEKAYLPKGGVVIKGKYNWEWFGTFEDENNMTLRTVLHGDMVKILMTRD